MIAAGLLSMALIVSSARGIASLLMGGETCDAAEFQRNLVSQRGLNEDPTFSQN